MTPETFTDDIAPAFPSSLLGPLQVVDPNDSNSWIKVDPAGSVLQASGDARPTRKIVLPFSRVYATATQSTLGVVIPTYYVASITNGGFYVSPFPIPDDMDLSEPSYVRLMAASLTASTETGAVVRFVLGYTYGKAGETPTDGSLTLDWSAPDNWAADEPRTVLMDDGSARTFAPSTFESGDELGLRISRVSTASEDTYTKSVKIVERLVFEYTAKEF